MKFEQNKYLTVNMTTMTIYATLHDEKTDMCDTVCSVIKSITSNKQKIQLSFHFLFEGELWKLIVNCGA